MNVAPNLTYRSVQLPPVGISGSHVDRLNADEVAAAWDKPVFLMTQPERQLLPEADSQRLLARRSSCSSLVRHPFGLPRL